MDLVALDRWITGGDPHTEEMEFKCHHCGEGWTQDVTVEYGGIADAPEECPCCGRGLNEEESAETS